MKKSLILTIICLAVLTATATAQTSGTGIGIIAGEPTGLSFKHWLGHDTAIDGAAAWSFSGDPDLHIHVDWLHHNWNVLRDETDITEGELPLYLGIGGRLKIQDDDSRVGIRFVVGIAYTFEDSPLDVFFEIAPVMDLVPDTELNGNAGIGIRFWF